jgi:hypothetical protein
MLMYRMEKMIVINNNVGMRGQKGKELINVII